MAAVRDVILFGVIIFALGIAFFSTKFIIGDVVDKLRDIPAFNESQPALDALQGSIDVTERMDYVVFGVFIGLVLGILVTGWFIAGNAIFSFIYFLVSVIGVALSAVLANSWETATQMAIFGNTLASFPITNNIMLNLPIYTAVIAFLGMVVIFAKPAITGGGAGGEFF